MTFRLSPPRIATWRRTRTHELADYGVFTVQRHEMEDGAGKPRRAVHCFTCPDWCNVIALTPADEVVMIWQYRFGTDTMTLEVPGGVIDPGEDPALAAERELREESGFAADGFELLVATEPNPALQGNRCFTYLARGARPAFETEFDDLEECEPVLVPLDALPRLLDEGAVTHALVLCGLERLLRRRALR